MLLKKTERKKKKCQTIKIAFFSFFLVLKKPHKWKELNSLFHLLDLIRKKESEYAFPIIL